VAAVGARDDDARNSPAIPESIDAPTSDAAGAAGRAALRAEAPARAQATVASGILPEAGNRLRLAEGEPRPADARPVQTVPAGPARIELAAAALEISPGEPVARILVRRRGNLRGDVTFAWWTESGTAKAERDFSAFAPHIEHIESAKDRVTLLIPIVSDSTRTVDKSFYVVIDDAGPGAVLGERAVEIVTIMSTE
jgi:hypothetical protein